MSLINRYKLKISYTEVSKLYDWFVEMNAGVETTLILVNMDLNRGKYDYILHATEEVALMLILKLEKTTITPIGDLDVD